MGETAVLRSSLRYIDKGVWSGRGGGRGGRWVVYDLHRASMWMKGSWVDVIAVVVRAHAF